MRFAIAAPYDEGAAPVWDDPASLDCLDRLLFRVGDAEHEMLLKDADLIENSAWLRGARRAAYDRLLELCELARASAWSLLRRVEPGTGCPLR
jgi:hypothetical protein